MSQPVGSTYEEAYTRLESLIEKLESGALTLEEQLRCFEEAAKLVRQCEDQLQHAEAAILRVTTDAQGQPREEPFDEDDKS